MNTHPHTTRLGLARFFFASHTHTVKRRPFLSAMLVGAVSIRARGRWGVCCWLPACCLCIYARCDCRAFLPRRNNVSLNGRISSSLCYSNGGNEIFLLGGTLLRFSRTFTALLALFRARFVSFTLFFFFLHFLVRFAFFCLPACLLACCCPLLCISSSKQEDDEKMPKCSVAAAVVDNQNNSRVDGGRTIRIVGKTRIAPWPTEQKTRFNLHSTEYGLTYGFASILCNHHTLNGRVKKKHLTSSSFTIRTLRRTRMIPFHHLLLFIALST